MIIPRYTDHFSELVTTSSIVASGGIAIINAPSNGLTNNDAVTINDIAQQTAIDSVSKDGFIYTFETSERHDLTLDYPGYENVTLGGFTQSEWNGSFKLIDVPTRRSFKIQSVNTLPILNTNEYLSEIRVDGINGRYPITKIDSNNFSISGDFEDGDYSSGSINRSVRIAGSVSIERSLEEYTEQDVNDIWAFVSMNDAIASKDRNALNDATATFANGEEPRLRIIDGFSVFLIGNVSTEITGVDLLDIFRHDLLLPLSKSFSGVRFSTGLSGDGDFKTILIGHNFVIYNRATLVYQYNFQFSTDITLADQVENTDTRAFSEIDYTQSIGGNDTTDMTFNPELPA